MGRYERYKVLLCIKKSIQVEATKSAQFWAVISSATITLYTSGGYMLVWTTHSTLRVKKAFIAVDITLARSNPQRGGHS